MLYVHPGSSRNSWAYGFARWERGGKAPGRAFPYDCAANAEKYARRLGPGARIIDTVTKQEVAIIVKAPAHKSRPITEVTWYGGRFL